MTVRLDSHVAVFVLQVVLVGGLCRVKRRAWASSTTFWRQRLWTKSLLWVRQP